MNPPTATFAQRYSGHAVILLHRLPARLRLEIAALRDALPKPNPEGKAAHNLAQTLERIIGDVAGVTRVCANPWTGSLLIEHDGEPGREAAIRAALYVVLPPVTPGPARLLTDLRRAATTLDRTALRVSDGWIDLKTALPLLLGFYGLNRLLTERPFRPPSSLTLLWWAYTGLRWLAGE